MFSFIGPSIIPGVRFATGVNEFLLRLRATYASSATAVIDNHNE